MDVVGKTIMQIHRGPWEAASGVDMPGLAGPTWHYCDVFLSLDDSTVLNVCPGKVSVSDVLPTNAKKLKLSDGSNADCIGRTIVDILEEEEPTILVLLDDGRYIDHSYLPGGSSITIGSFANWTEDDTDVLLKSIITGKPFNSHPVVDNT